MSLSVHTLSFFSCTLVLPSCFLFFFFNDTAPTEISPLSLHDALPISFLRARAGWLCSKASRPAEKPSSIARSEEHTSELQSPDHLVCRLLLEKKKKRI